MQFSIGLFINYNDHAAIQKTGNRFSVGFASFISFHEILRKRRSVHIPEKENLLEHLYRQNCGH